VRHVVCPLRSRKRIQLEIAQLLLIELSLMSIENCAASQENNSDAAISFYPAASHEGWKRGEKRSGDGFFYERPPSFFAIPLPVLARPSLREP